VNFNTVICSICGQRLTVSENAPKQLVCPKCLNWVANPMGRAAGAAMASGPRPVIPLEQQVTRDRSMSQVASVIVTAVILIGMVIAVIVEGITPATVALIVLVMIGAGVAWAVSGFPVWGSIKPQAQATVEREPVPSASVQLSAEANLRSLDYRIPAQFRGPPREPTNYLAAIGGFFLAIGVCIGGIILLVASLAGASHATSPHGNLVYLIVVVLAVAGVIWAAARFGRRPGWRGFIPGVTIGLTLGMLALGPCGFCYLISLA
jgi:ribosomal protein S27E